MSNHEIVDNLLHLSKPNIKFRRKVISKTRESNKGPITIYRIAITVYNKDKDIEIIHRGFTDYLFSKGNSKAPNTKLNEADFIVMFLNYIYFKSNIKDFTELKISDGLDFMNEYGLGKSKNTIINKGVILRSFYLFYAKKNVFKNIKSYDIIDDLFTATESGTGYLDDGPLHYLHPSLVMLFLDIAERDAPDVALGFYLQCFGGLRMSEVLNLIYQDIEPCGINAEKGMLLTLVKRTMRPDLPFSDATTSPKKPRKQIVFPCGNLLTRLYKKHKQKYKSITDVDAVFINKNGLPMTRKTYRDRFNLIKRNFINQLDTLGKDELYARLISKANYLEKEKWSTHIFRGCFSHMVASHAKSISEIAMLRGDKSFTSSLVYLQRSQGTKDAIAINLTNAYRQLCGEELYNNLILEYKKSNF